MGKEPVVKPPLSNVQPRWNGRQGRSSPHVIALDRSGTARHTPRSLTARRLAARFGDVLFGAVVAWE
jgi:hypothetical protein